MHSIFLKHGNAYFFDCGLSVLYMLHSFFTHVLFRKSYVSRATLHVSMHISRIKIARIGGLSIKRLDSRSQSARVSRVEWVRCLPVCRLVILVGLLHST